MIDLEPSVGSSESSTAGAAAAVKTLVLIDLVDSTGLLARLGDQRAQELFAEHDAMARSLLPACEGKEIDKSDGFLLLFDRPIQAVGYALAYQRGLADLGRRTRTPLAARAGIHLGEVLLRPSAAEAVTQGAKPLEIDGLAKHTVARVAALAGPGQTLLTHAAFDLARRATVGDSGAAVRPRWLAHGPYLLQGIDEPVEIFEVGLPGVAPLAAPQDTAKARRAVAAGDEVTLGWRPAAGQEVPWRHHWQLERKLGDGGFGEVWLACHEKTRDHRVFKFCYDAARLRALKREVTLFRILKDTLGERDDVARILDWNFKEAPFFLESEYIGSDLPAWAAAHGDLAGVPLAVRLDVVAQVATALGAAHSVGVLHKDIKPSNVLIAQDASGAPRARLTDFGIGLILNPGQLPAEGITILGFTELSAESSTASGAGTRLYLAPELLEGKVATTQSDIYALGVLLYQMAVGDLSRALAEGWERDVADEILAEDIACCVDREVAKRPGSALEVAERLRHLEQRRAAREAARRAKREAEETLQALLKSRRRRLLLAVFTSLVLVFSVAMALQMRRTALEAERANREAEAASRISEFLVGLFEQANPDATAGNTVTAREILDQGVSRIRSELQDQPEIRATLMATMARAYVRLSLYEPAIALQREALTLRERTLGAEHTAVAESLLDLGNSLSLQGAFEQAEPLLQRALVLSRKLQGENAPAVLDVTGRLADLKLQVGHYAEAERLYRDVLSRLNPRAPHALMERGRVLSSLALVHEMEGKQQGVPQLYEEALDCLRRALGPDHTWVALVLTNRGGWLVSQGRYEEAEASFTDALTIIRRRSGPQHPHAAMVLCGLAELANARDQFDAGERLARQALSILQAKLPLGHWRAAVAESILGASLAGQKRYVEAEPLLVASHTLLRSRTGARSRPTLQALSHLVAFYAAQGRTQETERYRDLLKAAKARG